MRNSENRALVILIVVSLIVGLSAANSASAADKPNILFIMGDDIG
jgi:hypothetical protein